MTTDRGPEEPAGVSWVDMMDEETNQAAAEERAPQDMCDHVMRYFPVPGEL